MWNLSIKELFRELCKAQHHVHVFTPAKPLGNEGSRARGVFDISASMTFFAEHTYLYDSTGVQCLRAPRGSMAQAINRVAPLIPRYV